MCYCIAGNFRRVKFSWFLHRYVVRGLNFVVSVNLESIMTSRPWTHLPLCVHSQLKMADFFICMNSIDCIRQFCILSFELAI